MTTLEFAVKNLMKQIERLESAKKRNDPSVDMHKEIVEHWKEIVGVLDGSK